MNSAGNASDPSNSRTFFVNFNQDCSSLAVGSKQGYRLYALNAVDALDNIYSNATEDTRLVERLFSSSLMAIVSSVCPRKLKVCHFKKGTEICNYSYSNTILAVKINRVRLVVCLEESLYIHNIRDMKVLHTIRETPPNEQGLCALSINSENCFLAYPGSNVIGEVQIFDTNNLHAKIMIHAHDSPLAALAFSPSGTRIATASEKGTVIRVFAVTDGVRLHEFRRGVKRCVDISCLAFSTCSQYLACSSNTETVHVFKLEEQKDSCSSPRKSVEESSWMGYLSTYLPTQVTDVFNQGRAFATAHLPFYGVRNVIAVSTIQHQLRLLVATEDGFLYVYNIETNEGGDLSLLKLHRLDGVVEEESGNKDKPDGAPSRSEAVPITNAEGSAILGSYAGILKGHPAGQMSGTESDRFREMADAVESPPKDGFQFGDDHEYPPLTQKSD